MKIITARDTGSSYFYAIHLDPSRVLADGSPDPAWIAEYDWSKEQDKEISKREMKLLAQLELGRRKADETAGKKLKEEGSDL